MGKLKRRIEWERIMGMQAWTAEELSQKLGLSPGSVRRYLKIYYYAGRLERKRFGRYRYYAVKRFLEPPDEQYICKEGIVFLFKLPCGCEFHIDLKDESHSKFKYCERHKEVKPHE